MIPLRGTMEMTRRFTRKNNPFFSKKMSFSYVFFPYFCRPKIHKYQTKHYLKNMKRLSLIMALAVMMALPVFAERVTPETARKVATTFLTNNGAKSAQLTDLTKVAGFQNLYIFTAEDGFVVMAADDCVQPILGYSLTNKFVADDMPDNLRWWLQGYDDQIADAVASKAESTAEVAMQWKDLEAGKQRAAMADVIVAPMIQTKWDQNKYYNRSCPTASGGPDGHVYTGCVATAMAQVMKYWDHPTTGNGSHSYTHATYGEQSVNFGETTYDWANMPNSLNNNSTTTQINAVAELMYHCGVSVDMNYGTGSSGAPSYKVQNALISYFKYSTSSTFIARSEFTDSQWIAFLKSELDESRPLFYSGSNVNSGHAFICDGYRSDDKFHFNWGWSGYDGVGTDNGYWTIGSLNPNPGSSGSGSGSGTYNLSNAVIAWVEPISELTAPSLSAVEENGSIQLTWNFVSRAASYDIYKDNAKIASVSTCEYTDNEVDFGTSYRYYVRAIASSEKSNPSNFISIMVKQHGRVPNNLALNVSEVDNSINLTWDGPEPLSASLHYGVGQIGSYYRTGESTYWGQKYSASKLSPFDGMSLNQVSIYAHMTGIYTLYLYKDNTSNKLLEQEFDAQYGWNDVSFDAIPLDCSSDLWVIFHKTHGTKEGPAIYGMYDEDDMEDAHYLFYDVANLIPYSLPDNNISWPIKLNITDGDFSYNIYRNNAEIKTGHTSSSFTDNPTENGNYEYYVKTRSNNWVSDASDPVSIDFNTMHTVSEAVSLNHNLVLSAANQYHITSSGALTVTGTMSNDSPENLILEDGAQLVHNSEGVKATVQKNIEPYSDDEDGWYFIASPVTEAFVPSADNGLLANNYDLYLFDQSEELEWRNIKTGAFSTIDHKTGYLYANNNQTTLTFNGTLAATAEPTGLAYDGNASLKGFNLVGNPYPCNTTIERDFYVIDENNEVNLAKGERKIAPCEGVFVKATAENETVTFNKATSAKGSLAKNCFDLTVAQGKANIDRARVRLGEGIGMEKLSFNTDKTQISLWQGGQDFAVAYADGQDEMPLSFKAAKNGTYTLSVEDNHSDLGYLHLIDNMTGDDIDLLATPSYTFEAKTTDYASRFRLVFAISDDVNGDNASDAFAYVSNGEIVITADAHGASLQVIDVTGRVVRACTDVARNVSTQGMTAGVYVLRLIDGDNVRTQKIVIE